MNKRIALVFVPVGIGVNVVGGLLAGSLKLPVFLDTIGTILAAAILGPWWGALTGGLTNIIMAL
jgi:energy-coupling factor transport system substrate-specific component